MNVTEKIMSGVNNLPTLPTVYSSLTEAIENPRTSSEKLANIISNDQASVFKILKLVNSPFYGFRGKIDTISQAILHLGFNEVKNTVFALSVINFFSRDKILLNFRPVDFWAHSIAVGIVTRMIGAEIGGKNLENYFLAGIIHDIGKLIFFEYAHDDYLRVLELVESKRCYIKDAENEVMGLDHSRAGHLLASKWKLPQNIQNSILHHHNGFIGNETDTLVASVHIGDIVARMLELGYPGDNLIPEPNHKVWDILNISKGFFPQIRKRLLQDFSHTIRLMLVE
ncbi:MAG: HDOD domain-containing protein [Bacteroidetes bacterium]|nr:HDOD domain-containing protein [Bacteroidota bacterium]